MSRDSCPGCDGTLDHIRPGETVGTYDPCPACVDREKRIDWSQVFVPQPIVRRATEPGDNSTP